MSSSSSYFKNVLHTLGIQLQSDSPNILQRNQAIIIRDLQKELENHTNYPNNIPDFISGVKCLCRSRNLFKRALEQSEFQPDDEDSRRDTNKQDSIFRIMLNVDALQNEVISIILDEINTNVDEEEQSDWVQLLIKQLLFLPYINDSQNLTFRLLEILEIATKNIQIDLLTVIPNIIPDKDHDEISKKLSTILDQIYNDNDFTCAIISCLNNLILSENAKLDMKNRILQLLNTTSSLATFSLIFSFLVTNCKPGNLPEILSKTRNALDSIMEDIADNENNKSDQLLTFKEIQRITNSFKPVCDGWINLINGIKTTNEHKSVDIIILIMLHGNHKAVIESMFKRKVKNQLFKITLLENALKRYLAPQILKDCLRSILEISECLLRLNDPLCIDFATTFYSITFGHKYTDVQQKQQIIRFITSLTGSTDKIRSQSLKVLKVISDQHLELLQGQAMQLMHLLDKTLDSELGDVKLIYDLLTNLTCSPLADNSMEAFQNMIHIVVRKQLGINDKILYCGIIGAVSTAKNIAILQDQNSIASDISYSNISDLPNENAQRAAKLLETAMNSTADCPVAQGLFYDQLAQMVVTTENLDKYFLAWLQDTITNNFQEIYITSDAPQPINDINLKIQYNLNSDGEINEPIAVKISELTINEENNNMLVFAPLFRLLRLITYRQNNKDLSDIDALLGCGVILPEIDPDIGIENYDSQQAPQVIDCLFHCINWFREIINAFVTQKNTTLKEKVLQRLDNLVKLEEIFINEMKNLPDHKLPPSYFYNVDLDISGGSLNNLDKTKSDRGKKRKFAATQATILTQNTQATTSKPKKTTPKIKKETPDYSFREMDIDLILLLKYPLSINESIPENKLYLTLPQFKFLLKDIVTKLNTVTKTGNNNVFSHLITVKPEDLIKDCVRLMPNINTHLIKIIDETKKLLTRSDGIHDSHEMFLQEATELKVCLGLNLELQALVLSWNGFLVGKNLPLLREYLKSFIDNESSQLISAHHLILEYLKCILNLSDYCLTLSCAVHLINIVKELCNLSTDTTPKKKLVVLSGKLLSIRWFNLVGLPESGATANLQIETLVKAHLHNSSLETISNIVSWIHVECTDLKTKDDNLNTFPSITKANFPILYRGVCSSLLEAIQNEIKGKTNSQHLAMWLNIALTMRNLMDIVKIQETRANLTAFLKKSSGIIKIFLSQGLPILEIVLKSKSDKVVEILRTLQQTTRFIHNLICHSKVSKDSTLMKHVPQMQLTLETLVNRVKAVLVANNCSSAFWMGALKNKNLRGEEILSQSTNTTEDNNEDELPAEVSDDESMLSARDESDTSLPV